MEIKVMALDAIIPYWRNPRRISDESVNAVMTSIREYGYQQPIVIDDKRTIIIGHTRYMALRRLGVKEAHVIVAEGLSEMKVKELRVIDNRVSEFTTWDFDKLVDELETRNNDLMRMFFPEIVIDVDAASKTPIIEDGDEDGDEEKVREESMADFICPACFHSWVMVVRLNQVAAGKLELT